MFTTDITGQVECLSLLDISWASSRATMQDFSADSAHRLANTHAMRVFDAPSAFGG